MTRVGEGRFTAAKSGGRRPDRGDGREGQDDASGSSVTVEASGGKEGRGGSSLRGKEGGQPVDQGT